LPEKQADGKLRPGDKSVAGPDCFKCRYFIITWDQERPYACLGMNFKSKLIPRLEVFRASGQPCALYTPKPSKTNDQ